MQVSALSDQLGFGSVVAGLVPADLADPEMVTQLRQLWADRGLILFRDTPDTPEFQLELSRCFGELDRHPVREIWVDGHAELISLISRPESGSIVAIDGREVAGWIPWHADTVYVPRMNRGGILRVIRSTTWGGNTGFIDRIDAYDRLPPHLRTALEGREIVYRLETLDRSIPARKQNVRMVRFRASTKALSPRSKDDFPPVAHPAVRIDEASGRKILNVSPLFAQFVLGMPRAESDGLLDELVDHIDACPAYLHSWQTGDMILWDNWRMLHSVSGAPTDEVRIMQRTTIGGDRTTGRLLGEDAMR